jgi:hypothetical protein
MLLTATGGQDPIDTKLNDLETQVATRSSQSTVDVIDAIVDAILADTTVGGPGPWTTATGFAVQGDAMALVANAVDSTSLATTAADEIAFRVWEQPKSGHTTPNTFGDYLDVEVSAGGSGDPTIIADAVWDEPAAGHNQLSSMGELLFGAGGGSSPGAVADAVWDELLSGHVVAGSSGSALNASGIGTIDLYRTVLAMNELIRNYTPTVVQSPIAAKAQIYAGDIAVLLSIPVMRDGVVADMSHATTITFNFQAPGSDVLIPKLGAAIMHTGGSFATYTTDNTIFTTTGRWRASVHVLWDDMAETSTMIYAFDVQPALPLP